MNDAVPDTSWISVATCDSSRAAIVQAGLLLSMGVPVYTWYPNRTYMLIHLLVPPDRAEEAKEILSQPPPSDEELARDALAEPPPDDL
jgi:hypothetical protein